MIKRKEKEASIVMDVLAGMTLKQAWDNAERLRRKTGVDVVFHFDGVTCRCCGQSYLDCCSHYCDEITKGA